MLKQYVVHMRHDEGTVRIWTTASSAESAAELVCKVELAPPSAVISVEERDNLGFPL